MAASGPPQHVPLGKQFTQAAHYVGHYDGADKLSPTDEQKLRFYGLYKQATKGACTTSKPSMWNVTASYKWQAWKDLGRMGKKAAKRQYVQEVTQLAPKWFTWEGLRRKFKADSIPALMEAHASANAAPAPVAAASPAPVAPSPAAAATAAPMLDDPPSSSTAAAAAAAPAAAASPPPDASPAAAASKGAEDAAGGSSADTNNSASGSSDVEDAKAKEAASVAAVAAATARPAGASSADGSGAPATPAASAPLTTSEQSPVAQPQSEQRSPQPQQHQEQQQQQHQQQYQQQPPSQQPQPRSSVSGSVSTPATHHSAAGTPFATPRQTLSTRLPPMSASSRFSTISAATHSARSLTASVQQLQAITDEDAARVVNLERRVYNLARQLRPSAAPGPLPATPGARGGAGLVQQSTAQLASACQSLQATITQQHEEWRQAHEETQSRLSELERAQRQGRAAAVLPPWLLEYIKPWTTFPKAAVPIGFIVLLLLLLRRRR